jgi:hypothetical protein
MPRAQTKNGLTPDYQRLRIRVRIIDPRPDAWRGEGTSPSFSSSPAAWPMVCSLRNTFPVFVLLTVRKGHAKRNPDLTSDPIPYPKGRGRECAEQAFRAPPLPAMGRLLPLRCVPPCEPLDFKHFAG